MLAATPCAGKLPGRPRAVTRVAASISRWPLTRSEHRLTRTGGPPIEHPRHYWLLRVEENMERRLCDNMLRRSWALPLPNWERRSGRSIQDRDGSDARGGLPTGVECNSGQRNTGSSPRRSDILWRRSGRGGNLVCDGEGCLTRTDSPILLGRPSREGAPGPPRRSADEVGLVGAASELILRSVPPTGFETVGNGGVSEDRVSDRAGTGPSRANTHHSWTLRLDRGATGP